MGGSLLIGGSRYLELLHNGIDLETAPFSDRGSRVLVYKRSNQSSLYVKLAERLLHIEPEIEAYRHRPPFINDLSLIDSSGTALRFEVTTYPHAVFLMTAIGQFVLTFHDSSTLVLACPSGKVAGFKLRMSASASQITNSGGHIDGLRRLTYRTEARIEQNSVRVIEGDVQVRLLVDAKHEGTVLLRVHADASDLGDLPPLAGILEASERRWHAWFASVPAVTGTLESQYYYAWWVVANNLVSPLDQVRVEGMMPSKNQYVGIWSWDSAFHALAIRHVDPELARDQLRAILHHQLPDGMLPDVVFDEGIVDSIDHPIPGRVTKPPVFAWAALKLHETDPDVGFLREIYEPLTRWNAWWLEGSLDPSRGLARYEHPYSSGLDDSPLWDHGLPVVSPDLTTYLSVQMDALSRMAVLLELREEAAGWHARADEIVDRMVRELYDPGLGYFVGYHGQRAIPEVTLLNFYPLWTGRLPRDIQNELLTQLTDSGLFWQHFPLSTVARSSSNYDPLTMWRGPTWANLNYIFIEAFSKMGREDLAADLRKLTLARLSEQPGLHEFYNPETGKPAPSAAAMFGWTAAVFIDLTIQATSEQLDR
jgi:glycogen debranching enzyme